MKRAVLGADLFCGGGGTSTGLLKSCRALDLDLDLIAINHWKVAVATHRANHPGVRHYCESIENLKPRELVPDGRLHVLVASPECIHHSRARGGKPMSDQSRASAWHILRWAEALYIDNILIENVEEFREWGPLGANGKPLQREKGKLFQLFLKSLRTLGYNVDHRVLCAADYGDATTRKRLFIQARKGSRKPVWPEPSHLPHSPHQTSLFDDMPRWRPAREIIDWSLPSQSIFGRKKPLADATLARIYAGLRKFCGLPYLIPYRGERDGQAPRVHSLEEPFPTITTNTGHALIRPFLVVLRNNGDARSLEEPAPTITAGGSHLGIAQPYIIPVNHGKGDRRSHSLEAPMPTVTTVDAWALIEPKLQPFIVAAGGPRVAPSSVEAPMRTILTRDHLGLCQPFLVKYYGTGEASSVEEPLDTITTRDRFGLVSPQILEQLGSDPDEGLVCLLDIHFRMLQPHELAAAMSFPRDYRFEGTREEKVRQIGNSVPVETAAALTRELVRGYAR